MKINKFLYLIFLCCLTVVFTACSSDDKDNHENAEKLIGSWITTGFYYTVNSNNIEYDKYVLNQVDILIESLKNDITVLKFHENKTFVDKDIRGIYEGKYSIKGNKLTFKYDDATLSDGNVTYDIVFKDPDILEMKYDMKEQVIKVLKENGNYPKGFKLNKYELTIKLKQLIE